MPYSGGKKKARYYIAETRTPDVVFSVNPETGRPEHHKYRWLAYSDLRKLSPERLKGVVEWAHAVFNGNYVSLCSEFANPAIKWVAWNPPC